MYASWRIYQRLAAPLTLNTALNAIIHRRRRKKYEERAKRRHRKSEGIMAYQWRKVKVNDKEMATMVRPAMKAKAIMASASYQQAL